jgi:hypothetical protein
MPRPSQLDAYLLMGLVTLLAVLVLGVVRVLQWVLF